MGSRNTKTAKTASGALKILWQEGFFRSGRKSGDVIKFLAKRGNNFLPPTIGMALAAAKYLTRKGKRATYEYIQKYPYVQEEIRTNKK